MRSPSFLYFLAVFVASAASSPLNPENGAPNCTFTGPTGAAQATQAAKLCPTITLSNIAVPAGTTFDLSKLADGTTVIFSGTTTWGYQEWDGSLLQIGGKNITIQGAPGAILNPDGARWWDGEGDNGKVKPKFFAAHNLVDSTITSLLIKNTPRQAVSIAGCRNLTITGMTIDNSAGDAGSLGHNTDGFDIGTSEDVVIDGATVWNQDDCVAVNSGVNITFKNGFCSGGHGLSIGSVGGRSNNTVDTVTFSNSTVQKSVNGESTPFPSQYLTWYTPS
jgi:polygalacturonase